MFEKYKKRCPRCGSIHVRTAKVNPANLVLIPANLLLALVPGLRFPLMMKCTDCSHAYTQHFKN
ncbi:MAG: hypothetical protein LR011_12270 [Verrucomicrobia bacterium]|nr:hypothetical protein [Verrucomicrobiota bacterium]